MHVETGRNIALHFVEELAELLCTVARHACADYAARLHVCLGCHGGNQACEECRRAVALVVVSAPLDLTGTHRQKRLRSIKGLYLALFIDADDQRLLGRIEIESDNVAHLLDELRIGRQLERLRAMRLQAEGLPDPMDRRRRYARRLRHAARTPVRGVCGLCFERLCDNLLDPVIADLAWRTASRLVVDAIKAMLCEPIAPRPDGLARDAHYTCDLAVVQPIGRAQNDLGPLRIGARDLAASDT